MPDVNIVKLKLRRGSDIQRQLITLDQGELGYVTDKKRVFVGDGSTVGAIIVGSRNFLPVTSNKTGLDAYAGDIVVENSLMYQLTGTNSSALSSWKYVGPIVDNSTIEFTPSTNIMRIKADGVGISQLGNIVFAQGGLNMNNVQGLSANVDNTTIVINTSNQLAISTVYANSILGQIANTQFNSSTVAGNSLSGSSNGKLHVNVDGSTIIINSNQLQVGNIAANQVTSGTFGADRIASSAVGQGLVGGNGDQLAININPANFIISTGNALTLSTLANATTIPLSTNAAGYTGFFSYSPASGATALITLSGVVGISGPSTFGSGYTSPPSVFIQPPTASGSFQSASAIAVITNGMVTSLSVTFSGSGYNYIPQITIDPPAHRETTFQVTTATSTGGVLSSAQTFSLSSGGFFLVNFGVPYGVKAIPIFNVPVELQSLTIATVTL